jgi:hypothetical protein
LHREYVDQLRIRASARLGQSHHFIEVQEPALASRPPPVGAFAAAAAFTVTRPSATANDKREIGWWLELAVWTRRFAATLNAGRRPFHLINYLGSCGGGVLPKGTMTAPMDRTIRALQRSWRMRPSKVWR